MTDTVPCVCPHDLGYELFGKIGLSTRILKVIGKRPISISRIGPEEIFRKSQVLSGFVAPQLIYLQEPIQIGDCGVDSSTEIPIIEVAIQVGPLRKKHGTTDTYGGLSVKHAGDLLTSLLIITAAGFHDLTGCQQIA